MADTYTTILNLPKFEPGSRNNTWGADFNTDVLDKLDICIAGVGAAIATTGGSSTISEDNSRARVQRITGTLTEAATINLPANATWWLFSNETSGNYSVTLQPTSGTGAVIQQGKKALVISDGSALTVMHLPSATAANEFSAAQTFALEDSGTNTVLRPVIVKRTTSGTAAAGIGAGVLFQVEDGAGNTEDAARIDIVATDVTNGSEDFDLVISLKAGGSLAEAFRVRSTGGLSAQTFTVSDANVDVRYPVVVDHACSTTGSSGVGAGIEFRATANAIADVTGRLIYYWTAVSSGPDTRSSALELHLASGVGGTVASSVHILPAAKIRGGSVGTPTGVSIYGTTTNDNADAGYVGQIIESEVLTGSAVSLTSTATSNITSISLTAGDWDVWGTVWLSPNAGAASALYAAVSTTSATFPTAPGKGAYAAMYPLPGATGTSTGLRRLSVASTTTVYLVANATFAGTCTGYGYLGARRVR